MSKLLERIDELHKMNGDLCDFSTRWKIDGDYMRCRTCKRNQLASDVTGEFLHSSACSAAETSEAQPWAVFLYIIKPIVPIKGVGCD